MQSSEAVRQLAAETQARIQELSEQTAPLLAELEVQRQRLDLLTQLLNLGTTNKLQANGRVAFTFLRDNAVDILRQAEQPLHISEIKAGLVTRGISIPGKGNDANLIAHLSKCPEVIRVSRGVYGLAERDLESANTRTVTARKRQSRQGTKRKSRPAARARRSESE